jgi:hypothetical protein
MYMTPHHAYHHAMHINDQQDNSQFGDDWCQVPFIIHHLSEVSRLSNIPFPFKSIEIFIVKNEGIIIERFVNFAVWFHELAACDEATF